MDQDIITQATSEYHKERGQSQKNEDIIDTQLKSLAKLSMLDYVKQRKAKAKELGVRASDLDRIVKDMQGETEDGSGELVKIVEPWDGPVNLADLLDEINAVIERHIVCNAEVKTAATLWIAYSWCIEHVPFAPLAIITAPEMQCGKTQLLEVMGRLSRKPLMASGITPAAVFRVVDAQRPTLLIDEVDTFLKTNEELRGIVNCGHSRTSPNIIRTVGDNHEPKAFNVFGAKVLCGIGKLPDTIMSRAIILPMRRKLSSEKVTRLRHADKDQFLRLSRQLARFELDYGPIVGAAKPSMPEALGDRDQDNWETLLSIADLAGGVWPKIARSSALALCDKSTDKGTSSEELLSDINTAFDRKNTRRFTSVELLEALLEDPEAPWATWNRGRPLSGRQLCSKLREFDIVACSIKTNGRVTSGFKLEQFNDAFARYLDNGKQPADDVFFSSEELSSPHSPSAEPTNLLHNKINEIGVGLSNFDGIGNERQPTSKLLNLNESRLVGCGNGVSGENKGSEAYREEWL